MLNFSSKLGLALLIVGFITSLDTTSCNATNATIPGYWECTDVAGEVWGKCHNAGGNDASCEAAKNAITQLGCQYI